MVILWNEWTSSPTSESSVSSTENDINTRLVKAWTAIGRLSLIWKLDLSDKIKCNFFPSILCIHIVVWRRPIHTTIWMHDMDADRAYRGEAGRQLHKNVMCYIEQILEATSHKAAAARTPTSNIENHSN